MTVIRRPSRAKIVSSRDVLRRQDDIRAARSPHPSLRYHRNRRRELALQTPRSRSKLRQRDGSSPLPCLCSLRRSASRSRYSSALASPSRRADSFKSCAPSKRDKLTKRSRSRRETRSAISSPLVVADQSEPERIHEIIRRSDHISRKRLPPIARLPGKRRAAHSRKRSRPRQRTRPRSLSSRASEPSSQRRLHSIGTAPGGWIRNQAQIAAR